MGSILAMILAQAEDSRNDVNYWAKHSDYELLDLSSLEEKDNDQERPIK